MKVPHQPEKICQTLTRGLRLFSVMWSLIVDLLVVVCRSVLRKVRTNFFSKNLEKLKCLIQNKWVKYLFLHVSSSLYKSNWFAQSGGAALGHCRKNVMATINWSFFSYNYIWCLGERTLSPCSHSRVYSPWLLLCRCPWSCGSHDALSPQRSVCHDTSTLPNFPLLGDTVPLSSKIRQEDIFGYISTG